MFLFSGNAAGQTNPGTIIPNVAAVSYTDPGGNPAVVQSNQVDTTTAAIRTPATLTFNRVTSTGSGVSTGPTSCAQGGMAFELLPNPLLLGGTPVDPDQPSTLTQTNLYHEGEPLFVTLSDPDQNVDSGIRDTVDVTIDALPGGDSETLRLTETDVNSGLFAGYVQSTGGSASPGDCRLQVSNDGNVSGSYQDPDDATDMAQSTAIVDPINIVFDATTGTPVNGAEVRLVDAATGAPAVVFGLDGVSAFPATITTGANVVDGSGRTYVFPNGGYRFPVVPPGNYRIEITAPSGYIDLSTASIDELQTLPGAPYALDTGSFGTSFAVADTLAFNLDVPLDPEASILYLQKTSGNSVASPGDFVQYSLRIENTGALVQTEVTIADLLPVGFRLMPGSTYIDEAAAPDPLAAPDGRTLTFAVGDLQPGESVGVRYVTEVTVGATGETAVNLARASSTTGAESNEASATLQLVDDLFTSEAIIVGRTIMGSCDDSVANDFDGVSGLRIYMDDGRYAITDDGGRFHFEGVKPGTHVVQLDLDTVPEHLEVFDCRTNSRFAGKTFSRFVDLRAGSLWRTDFHLREKPLPTGSVALELAGERAGSDSILYTLNLDGGGLPVDDLVVSVILPEGLAYLPGSSVINDARHDDPEVRGGTLSFRLGGKPAEWNEQLSLHAHVTDEAGGEITARAVASYRMVNGESGRTPVAEDQFEYRPERFDIRTASVSPRFRNLSTYLTREERDDINSIVAGWDGGGDAVLIATGHTDSNPIAPGHHLFADNYELSLARATAVQRYVAGHLGIPEERIRIQGRGPDEPVADNATDAGRARNRRVELQLERRILISPAELADLSEGSMRVDALTVGQHAVIIEDEFDFDVSLPDNPVFSEPAYVETLAPETRWLAPVDGFSPPIPSIKIAVQHGPNEIVDLSVNGVAVDPLNYVGTELNLANTTAISRWRGVDLVEGANRLTAIVRDADRSEFRTLETDVHYGGGPVRAELDREASRLIADGTTRPVVAVRLFDRYGEPARPSTTGAFSVDAPYRTRWEVEALTENQLVAVGDREPLYRVGHDGIAFLQLEPTTVTGEATIRLKYAGDREQEFRVWMQPAPRDWVMVGFAEGTLGYNTLSDNMVTAEDSGFEQDAYTDGQMSFFAKGRVKGEYLLTLAYRSDVDEQEAENSLFGTIDPNRYYTLYGDTTEQRFEAASRRGLFLKIERREFYALFGDFQSGLSVTELSRYDRSLNGFKSEYRGDNFAYNAFASDTDKAFIRDELNGDGTSGPYYLSAQPIVHNSDQIELQTRDRFRSEVILKTEPLTRFIDYSIDYETGMIFMKRPVPSRSDDFNPIFIVANYETREQMGENVSAGGRGSWTAVDGRVEAGASLIHQGTEGDAGNLLGADLRIALGDRTEFRAEAAATDTDVTGENYGVLAAVDHQGEKTEVRAWLQQLQAGFGLGQQNRSETGMRKFGVDGRYVLTDRIGLVGAAFRQDNLVDDAQQDVVEAEIQYQNGGRNASVGVIASSDEYADGESFKSNQLFVSGSSRLLGDLMTLRGAAETSLGGNSASTNYPDRVTLGLDWHITDAATMFTEVESAQGAGWDSLMTRVGMRTQPWQSAQFNSVVNHEMTEYGPRTFANLGLTQGWQASDRWYLDFGLDQSRTLGDEPRQVNPDAPPASGNVNGEDFLATFVGAMYRADVWTFTSRAEFRGSDSETRINLLGGFYREQTQGRGFSANLQWLVSEFDGGGTSSLADLRLGWSWRPTTSEWIVYDRLDLIRERNENPLSSLESWKVVNNLNANWMVNSATQVELQYGAKFVRSNIGSDAYTGFTDIAGAGVRRDLNERWDVGLHGDVLHSWNSDVVTFGWGVDVGVTVFENVWVSLGYNFAGFRDDDFSGANYTAQGPFVTFRIKADQETFHNLIGREGNK